MFCNNCGYAMLEGAAFCTNCGQPVAGRQTFSGNPLVGFLSRINDPAFTSYKKKSAAWSFIFSIILAIIAVIAFPVYGNASGEIDWPDSLYYGMGIGGMFILIALGQFIKQRAEKTWDGVVESKDTYKERDRNVDSHVSYDTVYLIKVRKESGRVKKHRWRNSPGLYNYYQVGDRVRHHKGFYYYEKYDKSRDKQIMCAACMTMNDINEDHCARCKCPLLK